jgi:hypothetical protein
VGRVHLQHHDGDDDGDHAIAEGFQPSLAHGVVLVLVFVRAWP